MIDRRRFMTLAAMSALTTRCSGLLRRRSIVVNDVHSALNPTFVDGIERPGSIDELREVALRTWRQGQKIAVSGSRHAMGGQQFASNELLVDMRGLQKIVDLDRGRGLLILEGGIEWPQVVTALGRLQDAGTKPYWGFRQKQTGADRLTLGGAVAANVHGRGLTMRPFVDDIEWMDVLTADGEIVRCSRDANRYLFRLVAGGYGLFGIVVSLALRLTPRRVVERVVEIIPSSDLPDRFARRISEGYLYGDFQFSIDERSEGFLREGVFSCYRPVSGPGQPEDVPRELGDDDWRKLTILAHSSKSEAYRLYASWYESTSGQLYWSDTHQMSVYLDDYHLWLDRLLDGGRGSEMITEIYVPRAHLVDFLEEVRSDFRRSGVNVIYGTVRLIEKDEESFLAWAREPFACVIFNLHVDHSTSGIAHASSAFQRLIEFGLRRGGSYYLTYHRWATAAQLLRAYPQMPRFLAEKEARDPDERFTSDWYRHYRRLFRA